VALWRTLQHFINGIKTTVGGEIDLIFLPVFPNFNRALNIQQK
jgi:hypothetical protein